MSEAVRRFLPLLDEVAREFCQMLRTKVEKEGRGERGKRSLTTDPSPDLFRFALEGARPSDRTWSRRSVRRRRPSSGPSGLLFGQTRLTLNCGLTSPPAYVSFSSSAKAARRSLGLSHKR